VVGGKDDFISAQARTILPQPVTRQWPRHDRIQPTAQIENGEIGGAGDFARVESGNLIKTMNCGLNIQLRPAGDKFMKVSQRFR
jgi:hypothetical protein